MGFFEKIREFILKLRALPEQKKKIIFFVVIAIATLIMLFFQIKSTKNNLSKIGNSLKSINLAKIDLPDSQFNPPTIENNNISSNLPISQSQNQTIDWETYKNNAYGFEIKFPKDWIVHENVSNRKFTVKPSEQDYLPSLTIQFLEKKYSEVIAEQEKQFKKEQIKDIEFLGITGEEFLYYDPEGLISQIIILSKGDYTVKIISTKNNVLDLILSTLKFTK